MALGKKLARFSFKLSAIGIFIYLMDPESSNTLGRSAVTFRIYCKQNMEKKVKNGCSYKIQNQIPNVVTVHTFI
jgi:hypothetical protein